MPIYTRKSVIMHHITVLHAAPNWSSPSQLGTSTPQKFHLYKVVDLSKSASVDTQIQDL